MNDKEKKSLSYKPSYHIVKSHYVRPYTRKDGTFVRGHWRDGDGDSTRNNFSGYLRKNPTLK